MTLRVLLRPNAEADLSEAFHWYENQRSGLGIEFLGEVERCLERVSAAPDSFQFVHREGGRTAPPFSLRCLLRRQIEDDFHPRRSSSGPKPETPEREDRRVVKEVSPWLQRRLHYGSVRLPRALRQFLARRQTASISMADDDRIAEDESAERLVRRAPDPILRRFDW